MSKVFKVSQSKVKLWRRCRAAYSYKYVDKLKRKKKSRPLQFGTIVHDMLEADANYENPFKVLKAIGIDNMKLFTAEKEMYGEILDDIRTIMRAYFDYWDDEHLVPIKKNGRYAEHEFEVELYKGIILIGKMDGVAKTKNGLRWLVENKTFGKALPGEDERWRNLQSAIYFKANDILGWFPNLAGIVWNYICSKPPTRPQLLKSGELSQKSISSLPRVIKATLEEHGFNKAKYKKLMDEAESNQRNYFSRIFTPINKELVDIVYEGFIDTAQEMREYHEKKRDMNIDKHCSWCDYEPLCRAKLTCSDFDFIKEREYTHAVKEQIVEDEPERSE